MNKYFIIALILFASCNYELRKRTVTTPEVKSLIHDEYPMEIKSQELRRLYDETKWRLYCIHGDEKVIFIEKPRNKDSITFGMLPLVFHHIQIGHDSIEIDFNFSTKGELLNTDDIVRNIPTWGVVYRATYDTVIWYSSVETMRYFWKGCGIPNCASRYVNPLQPEIVKYIIDNKNNIDPWFRKEAIKRGVIND
jgi:hypothetical protein